MIKAGLIALAVALMAATSAHAGGRHHGYGLYGYGHGYYGGHHRIAYGHRYGRRHYRRHRHDDFAYLAGGLLLGGLIVHSLNRPAVVEERVVYRRPIQRYSPAPEPVVRYERRSEPVPAEPPPYYYRKDPDGACWLIERAEDGSETITPEDPRTCG